MSLDRENIETLIDWIQLIGSENIGPITFFKLIQKYGSANRAIKAIETGEKTPGRKIALMKRDDAKDEYINAKSQNVEIIPFYSNQYPQILKEITDAPPILYVKGDVKLLNHPHNISIVGARNASINSRKFASKIAFELSENNINVISGMARGIDSSAHKGAMFANEKKGTTIAVLGTGIDEIYPEENKELYNQIIDNGLLVSELPMGTKAQTSNFPRRNRIVSGLSNGVLVVEATTHSGSLITAKVALEQNKDIFAVPGSPTDQRASGPNKLIKDGAILTDCVNDVLNVILSNNYQKIDDNIDNLDNLDNIPLVQEEINGNEIDLILPHLSKDGVTIDELIRVSNLSPSKTSMLILDLEMEGKIERLSGNKIALIK